LCACCLCVVNKLSSLLTTYNLSHTINFAQSIQNNCSIVDNIFDDNNIINLSLYLCDLLDHEVFVSARCPPISLEGEGSSNVRFCLPDLFIIPYFRTRAIPNWRSFVFWKQRQNVCTHWSGASYCRDVVSGSKTIPRQLLWRQKKGFKAN
jgi:hypothetical protein